MEKFKSLLYYFLGRVYIPKNLLKYNEDILLHISDTTFGFYPGLKLLLKELRPKYIMHTGDMVDNIKLGLYPTKRKEYERKVKSLIEILEDSFADKIYLVLGNHDEGELVKKFAKRSIIVEKSCVIDINSTKYKISHFSNEIIKSPAEYNLFGHDLSIPSKRENHITYLNGITGINIITLESKKVFILPYPFGTNDERVCKTKIGL